MPLTTKSDSTATSNPQIVFVSLLVLSLVLWIFYRALFSFPVWFDETLGKAIFFGAPILIFVSATADRQVIKTMDFQYLFPGLLRGLAFGGVFGFLAVMASLVKSGNQLVAAPVFILDQFWWQLFLALLTAFWESLFFFGFIQTVLGQVFPQIQIARKILLVGLIFLVFHLPNIVLRFSGLDVSTMIILLFLFALGQAIIFLEEKNIYTLILTQTIWGLVLMLHF